jgi:hypothetical protein
MELVINPLTNSKYQFTCTSFIWFLQVKFSGYNFVPQNEGQRFTAIKTTDKAITLYILILLPNIRENFQVIKKITGSIRTVDSDAEK